MTGYGFMYFTRNMIYVIYRVFILTPMEKEVSKKNTIFEIEPKIELLQRIMLYEAKKKNVPKREYKPYVKIHRNQENLKRCRKKS